MSYVPIILFLIIVFPQQILSQSIALDFHAGIMNYQGDLRQEVFTLKDSRPAFGLGVTADLTNRIAVRYLLLEGKLHADDNMNSKPQYYYRNLNFSSNISEQSIQVQLQLLQGSKYWFNLYIISGIASFRYKPYTFDTAGNKHYLQPLNTEGQGFIPGAPAPYRLREWSFPAGGGVRFRLSNSISISYEITFRYTLTDYLDDVSTFYPSPSIINATRGFKAAELSFRALELPGFNPLFPSGFTPSIPRGNPNNSDWYYFSGIKVKYDLFTISSGKRIDERKKKNRGRLDCPF